mmetsp:Transcript_8241/g.28411  ORF Transcript_8241/g.28411 Transcript_8241/m.28411 type:complete len:273 (+) Transcript_8241:457-1275(+)
MGLVSAREPLPQLGLVLLESRHLRLMVRVLDREQVSQLGLVAPESCHLRFEGRVVGRVERRNLAFQLGEFQLDLVAPERAVVGRRILWPHHVRCEDGGDLRVALLRGDAARRVPDADAAGRARRAPRRVTAVRKERRHGLSAVRVRGNDERRETVAVGAVDVAARVDELQEAGHVAVLGRGVRRRGPVPHRPVDVRRRGEELRDAGRVAEHGRDEQGRRAVFHGYVDVAARGNEEGEAARGAVLRGHVCRRRAVAVRRVDVASRGNEQLEAL